MRPSMTESGHPGLIEKRDAHSSRRSSADRHPVDPQRRLPDAHGHALPILAAHADTLVELQIVADHRHMLEYFGSRSDQRRALDGPRDTAVFDQVRLAGRERELAVRDVDLAAAEID